MNTKDNPITIKDENGNPAETHYSNRICPELSKATLSRSESTVVGVDGSNLRGPAAITCKGMQCMWFLPEVDQHGTIVNGNCAITASAGSSISHSQLLMALLEKINVAKIKSY